MPRRPEHPTPGAWFDIGMEEWSLALCPFAVRNTPKGFYIPGQTQARIRFGTEIRMILDRCNGSGHLVSFLEGMRWEQIPRECRRKTCCGRCSKALAVDLELFRDALVKGGLPVE